MRMVVQAWGGGGGEVIRKKGDKIKRPRLLWSPSGVSEQLESPLYLQNHQTEQGHL